MILYDSIIAHTSHYTFVKTIQQRMDVKQQTLVNKNIPILVNKNVSTLV